MEEVHYCTCCFVKMLTYKYLKKNCAFRLGFIYVSSARLHEPNSVVWLLGLS
jgi:hypothetical protein